MKNERSDNHRTTPLAPLERGWSRNARRSPSEKDELLMQPSDKCPSREGCPGGAGCGAIRCPSGAGRGAIRVVRWDELPYNPKLKEWARQMRKAKNVPEMVFWRQVKGKRFLGLDFDRQKVIGNYIVDFYCKKLGVIVEIDGSSHNHKKAYDQRRDDFLTGLGLKMIHIQVRDLMRNVPRAMEFLRKELDN